MPTASITDIQPDVDVEMASRHLELLHAKAEGYLCLVLLGQARRELHSFYLVDNLQSLSDPDAIDQSRQGLQDVVNVRWNVYTSCGTYSELPQRGRGTRALINSIPGVWADLDVKPDLEGYAHSEEELLKFTHDLVPKPTLEIASGSGGRHLYWLTKERVDATSGAKLLTAWLDYLRNDEAPMIENVHDTTRILRLAGTVRWPKVGEQTLPQRVELISEGPWYTYKELFTYSKDCFDVAEARRKAIKRQRNEDEAMRNVYLDDIKMSVDDYTGLKNFFNKRQDWDQLFAITGWTLHSDQQHTVSRCRYWTRPGKQPADGKSASTDFASAAGDISSVFPVMTIYTNDPGVESLWQRTDVTGKHGVCTKWWFTLQQIFHGDESALIRCVSRSGKLPS